MAEEAGFPTDPGDFFAFSAFACDVLLAKIPESMEEVAQISSQVVVAEIVDVVARDKAEILCTSDPCGIEGHVVQHQLQVKRTIKGTDLQQLLVNDHCSDSGKVAGLMNSLPEGEFVFFLDGPWQFDPQGEPWPEEDELGYGLSQMWWSVVRERDGRLEFPYTEQAEQAADLLAGYDSVDALLGAIEGL